MPTDTPNLLEELKRRKVLYAAGMYGVSAFAITEMATFLFENFGVPDWANRLLAALFVAGFPVAMFLSWAFDIGSDGLVRAPVGQRSRRWVVALAMLLLVVATGGLFYLIFPQTQVPAPGLEISQSAASSDPGFEPLEKLENSIAVLPFANLSADPKNEYFCDGVAEEILNRLGAIKELNLIGRTSSFAFKGRAVGVPQITSALGVRYLLQGSVRRAGNTLRITAQLLDEAGLQLWSESFDRELTDVFAIQDEIADRVALTVVPNVTLLTPQGRPPVFEAYEHYLKGLELLHKRQETAQVQFEAAVDLDPQFAEAHAELALVTVFGDPVPAEFERAQQLIDRALTLKPNLLRAREGQAMLYFQAGDLERSESVLRDVLLQNPGRSEAMYWLGSNLGGQGQPEEARLLIERAYRIDPLHTTIATAIATKYRQTGNEARAREILHRLIKNVPDTRFGYFALAASYRSEGRIGDAIAIRKRDAQNRATPHYVGQATDYAALGNWSAARQWIERSKRDYPDNQWIPYMDGWLAVYQGQYREAADLILAADYSHKPDRSLHKLVRGEILSLAGHHDEAIALMEPFLSPSLGDKRIRLTSSINFYQALAWSYLNRGRKAEVRAIVAILDTELRALDRQNALAALQVSLLDDGYYRDALNARLLENKELALDRLERADAQGWPHYYIHHHDPRWDALRDHPRFKAVMTRAQARADAMAAEVAKIDALEDASGIDSGQNAAQ